MLQSELREISGGAGLKVNNFSLLDDMEQHFLVCASLREKTIEVFSAISASLISNDGIADAIDEAGYLTTDIDESVSFHHIKTLTYEALKPLIQDAIDEYNDSIDELLNEPPRPASDFK